MTPEDPAQQGAASGPRKSAGDGSGLPRLAEPAGAHAAPAGPREIWDDLWSRLVAGTRSARHPFHLGVLATATDGIPDQRTVVLRGVDAHQHQLLFHTDARSPKIAALRGSSNISWLFYDARDRIQLRIACRAQVLRAGPAWEERWEASRPASRACYVHRLAPGTALTHPLEYGPVTGPEEALYAVTAAGRDNFAVVQSTAHRIDWLSLSHQGHRRLRFHVTPFGFDSLWLAP